MDHWKLFWFQRFREVERSEMNRKLNQRTNGFERKINDSEVLERIVRFQLFDVDKLYKPFEENFESDVESNDLGFSDLQKIQNLDNKSSKLARKQSNFVEFSTQIVQIFNLQQKMKTKMKNRQKFKILRKAKF